MATDDERGTCIGDDRELLDALHACASPDPSAAPDAVAYVARAIAEGGQLYPATPGALPAIGELLSRDDVLVKRELAHLLAVIIDAVDEVTHAGFASRIVTAVALRMTPRALREDLRRSASTQRTIARQCAPHLGAALRAAARPIVLGPGNEKPDA